MRYPIERATTIPGSGSTVYLYLLENIEIPARCPHDIWYAGEEKKLNDPHHPFKGFFPVGRTLKINYADAGVIDYRFTGNEKNAVYVKDLSPEARLELGIPSNADPKAKVFNPNFVKYDDLPHTTKISNQTTTMSLAKSISAFLCNKESILYTEQDVVDMLIVALKKVNSTEMMTILHGNHVSWCSLAFMRTGTMEADIKREFYGQNDLDFYVKDIGTIMPSILFTMAILGIDPVEVIKDFSVDLYGIDTIAKKMQGYMRKHQEVLKVA